MRTDRCRRARCALEAGPGARRDGEGGRRGAAEESAQKDGYSFDATRPRTSPAQPNTYETDVSIVFSSCLENLARVLHHDLAQGTEDEICP